VKDPASFNATQPIPVIEEFVTVSKRTVTTGTVTIDKTVEVEDLLVSEILQAWSASVERVSKGTVVDATDPPRIRTEDGITIIPVLEEVLVVEKRLILREELHIRHHVNETLGSQTVTLRREQVEVTRTGPDPIPES
jgi:stress response protein YsnF